MRYWLLTTVAWRCGFDVAVVATRKDSTIPILVLFSRTDVAETYAAIKRLTEAFTRLDVRGQDNTQPAPQEGTA